VSTVAKVKHWLFQPVDHVALQVPRALIASVLAAVLDCAYMFLLVEACRWQPVNAAVLSYLVGGFLQYILCTIWVFPSSPNSKGVSFLAFNILSLGGLGITWAVMAGGAIFLVPYGLSKILSLGFSFVWNFWSRKFLLFDRWKGREEASNGMV
jgi:putative flippase GtrA